MRRSIELSEHFSTENSEVIKEVLQRNQKYACVYLHQKLIAKPFVVE